MYRRGVYTIQEQCTGQVTKGETESSNREMVTKEKCCPMRNQEKKWNDIG